MADRILIASRAALAFALLPAALLAGSAGANAQESTRPGCVTRYDNGRPVVICDDDDEHKFLQQRRERFEAVVPRPELSPPVVAPSPLPSPAPAARPRFDVAPRDAVRSEPAFKAAPPPPPAAGAPAGARVGAPTGGGKATTGARPYAAPTARPSASGAPAVRLQAVRALIEPKEMPPREVAGYGIVAFTTLALSHDVERYKSVCEAYKATLMSQADLPPDTPLSAQMITYWPIGNKNTPEAQRADCAHLVANYAIRLGLEAIADADKKKDGLASRRGPFLIAWAPSESRLVPDAVVLVMDLSQLDTQRSFVEVFQDWRQHITDNPELWQRGGFNVEAVRRIIRDTFDRYGDGLLRLITSKT
jgi:hypothetical protein